MLLSRGYGRPLKRNRHDLRSHTAIDFKKKPKKGHFLRYRINTVLTTVYGYIGQLINSDPKLADIDMGQVMAA